MSILICFKIATLLKPDVLHKLHTKGEKERKGRKKWGKERGQAYLSLSITLEFFKLRKYTTN